MNFSAAYPPIKPASRDAIGIGIIIKGSIGFSLG
jgi:hypothetical protein